MSSHTPPPAALTPGPPTFVRPIIDAGPSLNFFSIGKERLLIGVLGRLSAPETVRDEVLNKAREEARFQPADGVWRKLEAAKWIEILADDATHELSAVVYRISQLPLTERRHDRKDLGETMVVAHAVVTAEEGETVTVLIDDGPGARLAAAEMARLDRLRARGRTVGSIRLMSTLTVLELAASTEHIPDKAAMAKTYERLRGLDDGLPPVGRTRLLSPDLWR